MERPILYVNACVRKESRTKKLAEKLLQAMGKPYEELRLEDISFPVVNEAFLDQRDGLIARGEFHDPLFALARQFARAEIIVMAAPFWDLSFPAMLKQYLEQINVLGITFRYSPEGVPLGLCRAKQLFYVTTAGGNYVPEAFGFGYVKALAENYYGIPEVRQIQAAGLDIDGADVPAILRAAEASLGAISFRT